MRGVHLRAGIDLLYREGRNHRRRDQQGVDITQRLVGPGTQAGPGLGEGEIFRRGDLFALDHALSDDGIVLRKVLLDTFLMDRVGFGGNHQAAGIEFLGFRCFQEGTMADLGS